MKSLSRFAALVGLLAVNGAYAQVGTVNSAIVTQRVYNDIPAAIVTAVNTYPTISLTEDDVGGTVLTSGFANRDAWQFSNNGGTSAYQFQNGDYFTASFNLTLTGTPITPRKEAGFLFSTVNNGDIQFIVNTDGHEVVQFGGISFYSFSGNSIVSYNSGDNIALGMSYFLDENGKNALQFFANGNASPVFEFGPTVGSGALDIGNGSTLGGYFQIVNDPLNAENGGQALFENINIVTAVPEPSVFALLSLGFVALLFRRRR